MTDPASSWTHLALWNKSKLYMERALDAPRDDDLFPFWSSLSLEFLARSALSYKSPLLLAEVNEGDGRNLLHALGVVPKIKNFIPKSLQISDVLTRCEHIVPDFTNELSVFCRGLINKRNEELHSGNLPFSEIQNSTWLPRFYEAANVLLAFQDKKLSDFVGVEEAKAAKTMLNAIADETAKNVKKLINAHTEVWNAKKQKEKDALILTAKNSAKPSLGHVVDCPACKSKAILLGEEIRQQPPVLEGGELVVRSLMLPVELTCHGCGLNIKGHSQLYAAELGSQFTKKHTYDPVDFYAYDEEDDGGYEFNNE